MIQNHQAVSALPVMVFLHGGGYVSGSGSRLLYGPELFMDRQVTKMSDWNSEIRFWKMNKSGNTWLKIFWPRWFWCASTSGFPCLADSTFLVGRRPATRWWETRWKPELYFNHLAAEDKSNKKRPGESWSTSPILIALGWGKRPGELKSTSPIALGWGNWLY